MARTLTAANTKFFLSIEGLFNTPQLLQGYAADNVFGTDTVAPMETLMGVDGVLSGGWVATAKVMNISLQADSQSVDMFERWYSAMQKVREGYIANGLVIMPATNRKYTLTRGFLTAYNPTPTAQKILQPRSFGITWQEISPASAI